MTAMPALRDKAATAESCRVPLGEVVDFIRGVSFDKADVRYEPADGYIPILRAGNIAEELDCRNDLVWVADRLVAEEQLLRKGDLAICMSSGSAAVVGKTAQQRHAWRGSVGAFCGIVRPRPPFSPDFLAHWFRADAFRSWRDGQARGASIQNLRFSELAKLLIPRLPLAEQERVAKGLTRVLATVNSARRGAQDRLAAAEALPAAYLREVFEGPAAMTWKIRALGEMVQGNGQYGTSQRSNSEGRGLAVLGMPHIHQGRIRWQNVSFAGLSPQDTDKYRLEVGDILFNRTNSAELVGKTAIFDGAHEAVFASYLIRYRALEGVADPHFICAYINSRSGRTYVERHMARAVGQVNISASTMHRMPIPCPPLAEQKRLTRELSRHFAAAESLIVRCREELAAIDALPASLLRAAFNGDS